MSILTNWLRDVPLTNTIVAFIAYFNFGPLNWPLVLMSNWTFGTFNTMLKSLFFLVYVTARYSYILASMAFLPSWFVVMRKLSGVFHFSKKKEDRGVNLETKNVNDDS